MGVDILLSSASRQGYSQDIVDIFAMPNGYIHQFRYASNWISEDVITRIKDGVYRNRPRGIMCFIDQGTKNITPELLPVRFATIEEVREHGTTKSIQLRVGDFCKTASVAKFNEDLRKKLGSLPDFVEGEIQGRYWLYDKDGAEDFVQYSRELGDWEALIDQYHSLPNPVEELPFYRLESIKNVRLCRETRPVLENGELTFHLQSGHEYSASIYHYHPNRDFPDVSLQVYCPNGHLIPLNGDNRVLHTRYDRKDYHFVAKRSMLGSRTGLSFRRTERESGKLIWEDVLLRIKIKPSLSYAFLYVAAVAVGFATPFVVRTADNIADSLSVILAAVAGGIIVGVATLCKDKLRL